MTEVNAFADTPWRAGVIQDFARSELFDRTFEEGMQLVEETAGYLDGAGRHDSKVLSRNAALGYATESMRLTTRLMQVASWLLVQRAVREGEMPPEAACAESLPPGRGSRWRTAGRRGAALRPDEPADALGAPLRARPPPGPPHVRGIPERRGSASGAGPVRSPDGGVRG
jgi:hypothetical protein